MNTHVRPTRAPAPPPATTYAEPHEDASFNEVERSNNLPARANGAQHVLDTMPERAEPELAPLPTTPFGNLAGAIAAVMAEIQPVEKAGWNKFHHYAHVRMQDLSRELTPLMGKHGIVVFQTEEGRELFDGGKAIAVRYRFTIVHKSGEIWPERILQTGLSACRNTKDGFDDKSLNKCHTSARKYFLMSLFQIPSEDDDGDNDNGQGQGDGAPRPRPQGRRPVPSPSGKLPPHVIAIVDQEAPEAWGKRFKGFMEKSETAAEVDKWYEANATAFDKLKGRFQSVYDDLIDAMDARTAQLAGGKSEGKPASDFPGDKPLAQQQQRPAQDEGTIPWALDRKISESDREWLMSLKEAFDQCHQSDEIDAEQDSIMLPSQGNVSAYVWQKAEDLVAQHKARVQQAGG